MVLVGWCARVGMFIAPCFVGALLTLVLDRIDPSKLLGSVVWSLLAGPIVIIFAGAWIIDVHRGVFEVPKTRADKDTLAVVLGLSFSLYLILTR